MARRKSTPKIKNTVETPNGKMAFQKFEDPTSFARHAGALTGPGCYDYREEWAGNLTLKEAGKSCAEGDLSLVEASDKILTKIEAEFSFVTGHAETIATVAGGAVNVPAMLSGSPMCMRRRRQTVSEIGPITVMVDSGALAEVSPETMRRRGVAVLALVRVLSRIRPVDLWVSAAHWAGSRGDVSVMTAVRIETAPLDLARAAFVLVHPAFHRRLMFAAQATIGARTGFAPKRQRGSAVEAAWWLGVDDYIAIERPMPNEMKTDGEAIAWVRQHLIVQGVERAAA